MDLLAALPLVLLALIASLVLPPVMLRRSRTLRTPVMPGLDVAGLLAFHRATFGDAVMQKKDAAFTLPEDISNVAPGELDALEEGALEAFNALFAEQGQAPTAEALAQLQTYRDAVKTVRGERDARQVAAQSLNDELASILAVVDEAATETDVETPAEVPVAEVVQLPVDAAPAAPAEVPVAVAASGAPTRVPSVAEAAARVPAQRTATPSPRKSTTALVAAADSGYAAGSTVTMMDLATIAERRFGAFPTRDGMPRQQFGIGQIVKPALPEALVASGSNDEEVLEYAASESRLSGGNLVAAGGWCAPSETWYDLLPALETRQGLITLPTVRAARGGVTWTPGPQFSDFYQGTGFFTQTEAQAIAETLKPTFKIGCPTFQEARLEAYGLQLQAGILQNRGYPEYVRRFIEGSLTAHAHRMNAARITKIVNASTAVDFTGQGGAGAVVDTLGAVEVTVIDTRYKYRMAPTATLELKAPFWLKGLLRADLAKRNGVEMTNVSDAMLDAHFALRGVSVEYLYDWQDSLGGTIAPPTAAAPATNTLFGSATPAKNWPDTVQLLAYIAGTFVELENDLITLDAVYDSTLFTKNQYTALFTEEAMQVIKRGYESRLLTIPLRADGVTGAQTALAAGQHL